MERDGPGRGYCSIVRDNGFSIGIIGGSVAFMSMMLVCGVCDRDVEKRKAIEAERERRRKEKEAQEKKKREEEEAFQAEERRKEQRRLQREADERERIAREEAERIARIERQRRQEEERQERARQEAERQRALAEKKSNCALRIATRVHKVAIYRANKATTTNESTGLVETLQEMLVDNFDELLLHFDGDPVDRREVEDGMV